MMASLFPSYLVDSAPSTAMPRQVHCDDDSSSIVMSHSSKPREQPTDRMAALFESDEARTDGPSMSGPLPLDPMRSHDQSPRRD